MSRFVTYVVLKHCLQQGSSYMVLLFLCLCKLCVGEAIMFSLMSRCPDILCQRRHCVHFTQILNRFQWNLLDVITTTNRWTDYISGEIVQETREQEMIENWIVFKLMLTHSEWLYTHTCSGGGKWPHTVFSSLIVPWLYSVFLLHVEQLKTIFSILMMLCLPNFVPMCAGYWYIGVTCMSETHCISNPFEFGYCRDGQLASCNTTDS